MRGLYVAAAAALLLTASCGPSYGGNDVKTPDQIVAEQEKLGAQENAQEEKSLGEGPETEINTDKRDPFDKTQAKLALAQAGRSAATCVGVVTQAGPEGKATFSITFANNGHVKDASVDPPFAGTDLGKCALQAMKAVIVPPFRGSEVTMSYDVQLTKEAAAEAKKEKPQDQ
jgi:hypothetical protein